MLGTVQRLKNGDAERNGEKTRGTSVHEAGWGGYLRHAKNVTGWGRAAEKYSASCVFKQMQWRKDMTDDSLSNLYFTEADRPTSVGLEKKGKKNRRLSSPQQENSPTPTKENKPQIPVFVVFSSLNWAQLLTCAFPSHVKL